jgi:glutathione S-transferase
MTAPSIPTQPLAMLTFAPMIDSELSRLILAHYAIPYREEPHLFGWASVLALLHGGYGRVPLIYGGGRRLTGPRALVDHFDALFPEDRALLPARQPLRTQVEEAWERYNGELATYTARVAYFHLLPARDIMLEPFSRGVPRSEAAVVRPAYGLLRWLFTMLLRLKPATARDALARVRTAFDRTDRLVADGRRYLAGGRLTMADLALASAAAPMLLPAGYAAPVPPLAAMPPAMQAIVAELRQHPTARFVERIYALHPPQPAAGK